MLFTLYLKEDVDEHGNVKEGVEGSIPLALRGEEERKRYEAGANGEKIEGKSDVKTTETLGNGEAKKENAKFEETRDDDVD